MSTRLLTDKFNMKYPCLNLSVNTKYVLFRKCAEMLLLNKFAMLYFDTLHEIFLKYCERKWKKTYEEIDLLTSLPGGPGSPGFPLGPSSPGTPGSP